MGLREYFLILRARWLIVISCALVLAAAVGVWSFRQPRVYEARTSVFFSVSVSQTSSELTRGFAYAQGLVSSYAQVATQPVVLNPVIQQLQLKETPVELSRTITAQAPLDTVILDIAVQNGSPRTAAAIANAVADQLKTTVSRVVQGTSDNVNFVPVRLTTVSPAAVPSAPTTPRIPQNIVLALLVGAGLGVVLAFVRDVFDARIATARDVGRITDAPVIGSISEPGRRGRLSWLVPRRRGSQEQTKELRTNFEHLREARRLRSVVFTSAHEDGATALTVAGLGVELAHAGVRTILVDGDMRKPSLSQRYTPEGAPGLSSILLGSATWQDVVVKHPGQLPLFMLPAGPVPLEPSVMLQREVLSALVAELAGNFDVVLVKAPPVLRVAEGLLLSRLSDGAIVVADEPEMNRTALADEVRALEVANAKVLGVVLVT